MKKTALETKLLDCLFFVGGVLVLFSLSFLVYSLKWEEFSISGILGMLVAIIVELFCGCLMIWIGSYSFVKKGKKPPPSE